LTYFAPDTKPTDKLLAYLDGKRNEEKGRQYRAYGASRLPADTPQNEKLWSLDGNKLTRRNASPDAAIASFNASATKVDAAANQITAAPPALSAAGTPFGTNAGSALQSSALQWGNAAGAAIAAAVGNLNIGVNAPQALPASKAAPIARPVADTGLQGYGGPR
jgi:hypothetical protein